MIRPERGEEPKRIEKSDLIIQRGEREADRILDLERDLTPEEVNRAAQETNYAQRVLKNAERMGPVKRVPPKAAPPQTGS